MGTRSGFCSLLQLVLVAQLCGAVPAPVGGSMVALQMGGENANLQGADPEAWPVDEGKLNKQPTKADLEAVAKETQKQVDEQLAKDEQAKEEAAKHPPKEEDTFQSRYKGLRVCE